MKAMPVPSGLEPRGAPNQMANVEHVVAWAATTINTQKAKRRVYSRVDSSDAAAWCVEQYRCWLRKGVWRG